MAAASSLQLRATSIWRSVGNRHNQLRAQHYHRDCEGISASARIDPTAAQAGVFHQFWVLGFRLCENRPTGIRQPGWSGRNGRSLRTSLYAVRDRELVKQTENECGKQYKVARSAGEKKTPRLTVLGAEYWRRNGGLAPATPLPHLPHLLDPAYAALSSAAGFEQKPGAALGLSMKTSSRLAVPESS